MLKDKVVTIKYKYIDTVSLLLLEVPLFIFLCYWSSLYIGYIAGILMFILHFYQWKKVSNENLQIKMSFIMLILLVCLIWVFWSGIGGYFFQSSDHGARNAIYHDLLNFKWPVIYGNGRYLNYYFGYWLVPAFITKMLKSLFLVDLWVLGEFILYIYTVIYIFVIILQIIRRDIITKKNVIIAIGCLVFFSGLDVCGLLVKLILKGEFHFINEIINWWNSNESIFNHIEWWANRWQYSSNTTQLFWVFNQALPAWLSTLIILNRNNLKQDLYIGVLTLFLAPFPACGLILISIGKIIVNRNNLKEQVTSIISKENFISILFFIFIFVFYLGNSRVIETETEEKLFSIIKFYNLELKDYILLFLHLLFEVLIFFPTIKNSKYKIQGYVCLTYLLILPFINFRGSYDFQMRSSIPELFFIMLVLIDQLINFKICSKKIKKLLLIITILGAITPLVEFARGIKYTHLYGKISNPDNSITSFDGIKDRNFIGDNFYESEFYKILK
ncbi:hypothetical protein YWH7199_06575 [Fusobacterium nucleatum YWH7199]|uniref:hypothetical protein n=1 Tax=Fusobacterium nucleatum TaxID=851 RepID=UPI00201A315B|nr:hypothetical protein [Fusobacterium nucleatum]MCL4581097.1 hypothetical protein [Fusobacterium nucleatum YWH7199]